MNIADYCQINPKKYNQWLMSNRRYNKCVTSIEINDFDQDVSQVADQYGMDEKDD